MISGDFSSKGNVIAEFLVAHQSVMAPLIDWGTTLLLLGIVLSPFLLIRLTVFRPTRWWHVVGAYLASSVTFALLLTIVFNIPRGWTDVMFPTYELLDAYDYAPLKTGAILLLAYPILVFYCTKLLYGSFTFKRLLLNIFIAFVFGYFLWKIVGYLIVIGAGWAFSQHF